MAANRPWGALLGLCALVALAAWAAVWGVDAGMHGGAARAPRLAVPLPAPPKACPVSDARARAHAAELEVLAAQSWERVPYDYAEAPLAWLRLREAEVCFRVAAERLGAQRVGQLARSHEEEIGRLWIKSVLALEVAWKQRAMAQVAREVRVQQALLSRGDADAEAYRGWLASLGRKASDGAEGRGL